MVFPVAFDRVINHTKLCNGCEEISWGERAYDTFGYTLVGFQQIFTFVLTGVFNSFLLHYQR